MTVGSEVSSRPIGRAKARSKSEFPPGFARFAYDFFEEKSEQLPSRPGNQPAFNPRSSGDEDLFHEGDGVLCRLRKKSGPGIKRFQADSPRTSEDDAPEKNSPPPEKEMIEKLGVEPKPHAGEFPVELRKDIPGARVSEHVPEDVFLGIPESWAGGPPRPSLPEEIIVLPLLGVDQDAVSLADLLEALFRLRVPGVAVGMAFQGQLPEGLFYLLRRGLPADP